MNLFDILACPKCRVQLNRQEDRFFCQQCGTNFPIINGVPILFPDGSIPDIHHQSELSIRETYDPWVHRILLQSLLDNQVVLEIGSGNMALDDPCIIRMDVTLSPYVDLVADAHHLPFLPSSLDYIFSLAVVEHLRNPFLAAQSMYEALKDGGYIYHECNFVYAYHAYPHHYFNASLQGMEQIFSQFTSLRKGVATYQMPSFALNMVLRTYLQKTHAHQYSHGQPLVHLIQQILDLDLMQYDIYFSEEEALYVAAGTYFSGLKQLTPQSTLIPSLIVDIWQKDEELKQRFPNINLLTETDNVLVWAKTEGRSKYPEIAMYLDSVETFNKRGSTAFPDRTKIHSLPLQEAPFGAIGFDPKLPMATNAQIAEHRFPFRGEPASLPKKSLLSKGLRVLKTEGPRVLVHKALQYLRQKF